MTLCPLEHTGVNVKQNRLCSVCSLICKQTCALRWTFPAFLFRVQRQLFLLFSSLLRGCDTLIYLFRFYPFDWLLCIRVWMKLFLFLKHRTLLWRIVFSDVLLFSVIQTSKFKKRTDAFSMCVWMCVAFIFGFPKTQQRSFDAFIYNSRTVPSGSIHICVISYYKK